MALICGDVEKERAEESASVARERLHGVVRPTSDDTTKGAQSK